jgi:hypothetical protein
MCRKDYDHQNIPGSEVLICSIVPLNYHHAYVVYPHQDYDLSLRPHWSYLSYCTVFRVLMSCSSVLSLFPYVIFLPSGLTLLSFLYQSCRFGRLLCLVFYDPCCPGLDVMVQSYYSPAISGCTMHKKTKFSWLPSPYSHCMP